jgi:hypothetical protein
LSAMLFAICTMLLLTHCRHVVISQEPMKRTWWSSQSMYSQTATSYPSKFGHPTHHLPEPPSTRSLAPAKASSRFYNDFTSSAKVRKPSQTRDANCLEIRGQPRVADGRADGLGIPPWIRDDMPKPEAHPAHIIMTWKLCDGVGSTVRWPLRQMC